MAHLRWVVLNQSSLISTITSTSTAVPKGKTGTTNGGPGMAAGFTKHLKKEVTHPVGHGGLGGEFWV